MWPLYGGGYWVAVWQVAITYYCASAVLHWVVPALWDVKSVQKGQRRPGQVLQEARDSIGKCATGATAVRAARPCEVQCSAVRFKCLCCCLAAELHPQRLHACTADSTAAAASAVLTVLQAQSWSRRGPSGLWTSCMRAAGASSTAGGPPPTQRCLQPGLGCCL